MTRRFAIACSVLLLGSAAACSFDDAFDRYCRDNPNCALDAGVDRGGGFRSDLPPAPPPRICAQPRDCEFGREVCHPQGRICVLACQSVADCPAGSGGCAEVYDPLGGRPLRICTCTAELCAGANPATICHPVDNICEPACTGDAECGAYMPPRLCDRLLGACLQKSPACRGNRDCPNPSRPRCDPLGLLCVGCLSSADCQGRPDGLLDCSPIGGCIAPR